MLKSVEKQPLSPLSTPSQTNSQVQKQKRPLSHDSCLDKQTPSKRLQAISKSCEQVVATKSRDPVAYWVETKRWPKDFGKEDMSKSKENLTKRRSTSIHHSDRLERLIKNGIFMRASVLMQRSSKDLCSSFLAGDCTPGIYPGYPSEQIDNVLARIQDLNEGRLQRDITPWVVPSAENLYFSGKITSDYIGEEIQAQWTRCATMGSTRPKPDYVAGLLRKAFTGEEVEKLKNIVSLESPWLFTPNLCFPFLTCEAKTGLQGLDEADRQNIHSTSIAIRAIIELYKAAFGTSVNRVNELYGKVLAFSVSHNNKQVNLYGHYCVPNDGPAGGLNFFRYEIDMFSFTLHEGAERFKSYNFILNVYEKFAPEHRNRIKDAIAFLPTPAKRSGTSFAASDMTSEERESHPDSGTATSQRDSALQHPAAAAHAIQLAKIREELEQERQARRKMEEQIEGLQALLQERRI